MSTNEDRDKTKYTNKRLATHGDLIKAIDVVVTIIEKEQEKLNKVIDERGKTVEKALIQAYDILDDKIKSLKESLSNKKDVDPTPSLLKAIKAVEKQIPVLDRKINSIKIPGPTDLSGLEKAIANLEKKIENQDALDRESKSRIDAVASLEEKIDSIDGKLEEKIDSIDNKYRHANFGRVVREVQAGGDVLVDNSDPNRPIVTAAGPLFEKPAGEPIVILAYGDSTTDGFASGGDSTAVTQNSRVKVYATAGTGAWNASNLQWRDVNVNATRVLDYPSDPTPYVGLYRGANGSISYSMADRLQKRTGRDVYVFACWRGSKFSSYYLPGGGAGAEGMTGIDTYLPTALSLIPGSPTSVDYVIAAIGINDINFGIADATILSNWNTTRAHLQSQGYTVARKTRTFVVEPSREQASYASGTWRFYETIANTNPTEVAIISSAGVVMTDDIHFDALDNANVGRKCADIALTGKVPAFHALPLAKVYGGFTATSNTTAEDAYSATAIVIKNCWDDPPALIENKGITPVPSTGVITFTANQQGIYRVHANLNIKGTANRTYTIGLNSFFGPIFASSVYVETASDLESINIDIILKMPNLAIFLSTVSLAYTADSAATMTVANGSLMVERIDYQAQS
jgi:hypothetical protein